MPLSVKVYYSLKKGVKSKKTKDTKRHVDINYQEKDKPLQENSQEPGSPVLILTFGGKKLFTWDVYSQVFPRIRVLTPPEE